MAAYNPMSTLSVTATSGPDVLGLGVAVNQGAAGSLSLEGFDRDMAFDDVLLDNVNNMPPLPFTPSYDFETFSTTFEDPFPFSAGPAGRPYELVPHDPEGFHESASPPEEGLDNKLLGFSEPVIKAAVIDDNGQFSEPAMTAELFGMFFLAEDVYSAENTGRPLELTCYRRNLWWCSGQISLPRQVTHVVTDQGRQVAVLELAASITASESIEGKPTEIICIPWKSASNSNSNGNSNTNSSTHNAATNGSDEAKPAGSPPNLFIDLANGQELDNGLISVPISWKRLQFKHATANNGRRKGQQQHYVVQINLLARVRPSRGSTSNSTHGGSSASDNGAASPEKTVPDEWIKIAEIQSGPVIVRGRSPRNFVSRRDVPLTSSSSSAGLDKKTPMERHCSFDGSLHLTPQQQQRTGSLSSTGSDIQQTLQRYHGLSSMPQTGDWTHGYGQQSPHPAKKVLMSPNLTRPPVPSWDARAKTPVKALPPPQNLQQYPTHPQSLQSLQNIQNIQNLQNLQNFQNLSNLPNPPNHHHQQPQPQPQPQPPTQSQQPQQQQRSDSTARPINLSLSDDERSPGRPNSRSPPFSHLCSMPPSLVLPGKMPAVGCGKMAVGGGLPGGGCGSSIGTAAAPSSDGAFEDNDLLYEYFPLSLDDWMPPVDAIYRPHVVHHTLVPPEVKAQQVRNKTKRYFAAD